MGKAVFTPAQNAFAFYTDGTESGATSQGINTNYTATLSGSSWQGALRLRIQETGGAGGAATDDYQLQVSLNSGAYANLPGSLSQLIYYNSTNLTDSAATTNRLGAGTGSFVAGEVSEDGLVDNLELTASNFTELLYAIEVNIAAGDGDTFDFRVLHNGATMAYNVTPRITVSKPTALSQTAWRYYADGTENGSTALAAQNTNYTADVSSGDINLGLRVRLQETAGTAGAATDDYQLQYELNDSGTYENVGESNIDSWLAAPGTAQPLYGSQVEGFGPAFTGNGETISTVKFYLSKQGSPTGNATAKVYAHTGTFGTNGTPTGAALATSGNLDVSTLTTTATLTTLTFSGGNQIAVTNGTKYFVVMEYTGGDASNYLNVFQAASNGHPGNASYYLGGSWTDWSQDFVFVLNSTAPPPVLGFNSASLTDGNATTNRLGAGTGSFVAGEISEDGLVDNLQITASNYTELLYSLTVDKESVNDADTLDFRVLRNGATTGMTYTVTPRITINKDPTFTQAEAAFYEDGTESGSTVIDSGADSITRDVSSGDSNLLLRMRLQETNGGVGAATDDYQLQYELNDSGTYSSVGFGGSIDSYDFANHSSFGFVSLSGAISPSQGGQSFTGNGMDVKLARFYLRKTGSPTGNMVAYIYAHTGTFGTSSLPTGSALATSDSVDVSALSTTGDTASFNFATPFTTSNGTRYCIMLEYTGGDGTNRVDVGTDTTSSTHGGNAIRSNSGLEALSTIDCVFEIYDDVVPILNFNSASLTDGNATTNRLGSGSGSFLAGEISEDGLVDNWVNTANNYTEHLWALTIDSDAVDDADTLDFRVLRNGATTGMTYTVTPRITIEKSSGATLVTQDIAHSFTLDNTTITQNHVITAQDTSQGLTLDNTTITQNHVLAAQDISHGLTIDNTTVDIIHNIATQDIEHGLTLDNTTITQNHVIDVDDIAFSHTLDNGTIAQNHVIVTQDISHGLTVDTTTIAQNHVVAGQDVALGLTTDNTTIAQNHVIATQDISEGLTLDNATINQNHIVVAQDIEHGLTLDNTSISIESANYDIETQDISHTFSLDNATITQNHIIATDDIAFSHQLDGTTVEETNFSLTVQDISIGLTTDNTSISQNHIVASNDISQGLTLDNTTLTQNHVLQPQDTSQGMTIDATTITQNHVLATQDIAFAITADNGTISQNHIIVTQDVELGLTTDNTTLDLSVQITPQDISHSLTLDTTTISQNHVLAPDDIAFSVTADEGSLGTNYVLATEDIALGLTLDNTTLAQIHAFAPDDLNLSVQIDNTTVTETNFVLAAQDIAHSLTLDNTTITQNQILAVQDLALSLTEDNATITQVHIVAPEDIGFSFTTDSTTVDQNHVIAANDIAITVSMESAGLEGGEVIRKYYIDTSGNVYWIISETLGLVEKI